MSQPTRGALCELKGTHAALRWFLVASDRHCAGMIMYLLVIPPLGKDWPPIPWGVEWPGLTSLFSLSVTHAPATHRHVQG